MIGCEKVLEGLPEFLIVLHDQNEISCVFHKNLPFPEIKKRAFRLVFYDRILARKKSTLVYSILEKFDINVSDQSSF